MSPGELPPGGIASSRKHQPGLGFGTRAPPIYRRFVVT